LANALARMAGKPGLSVATWPIALPAGAAEVDPIFAVIAAHRAAVRAYVAACDDEADEYDEDILHETCFGRVDALKEMVSCRPTTLPGVVALLEYLGEPDYGHDPDDTVLVGAVGFVQASVNELPRVLAETIRSLIGGES
jgi:hypothetical protein